MIISSSTPAPRPAGELPGALCQGVPSFDGTKFGFAGIRARYRDRPGRRLRFLDPFNAELVDFGSPLFYENWLLRRFDPSIVFLDASEDAFEVLHHGRQLSVKPQLHWAGWSRRGTLELVADAGREIPTERAAGAAIVARAHGLSLSLRGCQ